MASFLNSAHEYAVVIGLDLNGLGVLRALGKAAIPTIGLDTELNKPSAATRFGTKRRITAVSGPKLVDDLLILRRELDRNPVLLLTQEASVVTVSAERDRLSSSYRFTMPSRTLMEDLLSKPRFQALAERHGYPIPRAIRVFDGYPPESLRSLKFPCILKPPGKHAEYGKRFAKAYKVSTAADISRLWSQMRGVIDEVIVQEWIEGEDSDVYFCLQYRPRDGGHSVSFVGRKVCQWPPLVGGTASCIPAPEVAEKLTALTDGFFAAVGFVGVGSMEYKRDRRDGIFYMIEPTVGRTDFQEEIASLNGVNIPLALYHGELGLPAALPDTLARPRAWRDPFGYAKARQAGAPDPLEQLSPGIEICDAYRRLDDPMPYIALKMEAVQNRLERVFRRIPRAAAR